MLRPPAHPVPCHSCGFELYHPVAESATTGLGLYDDARFPGRCILMLQAHYTSLEQVPPAVMQAFGQDIQRAMWAIRVATGAARVNVAILGNRDPHVHAHLIPRWPNREAKPDCSPWDDPRPKAALPPEAIERLVRALGAVLRTS